MKYGFRHVQRNEGMRPNLHVTRSEKKRLIYYQKVFGGQQCGHASLTAVSFERLQDRFAEYSTPHGLFSLVLYAAAILAIIHFIVVPLVKAVGEDISDRGVAAMAGQISDESSK